MNIDILSKIFSTILIVLALVHHLKCARAKNLIEKLDAMQYCNWLLAFAILARF